MKRTSYLIGIALMISLIGFLGFVGSAHAYNDCDDQWSTPNGYVHAKVTGTYSQPLARAYYRVYHEADIFECIRGRTHFWAYDYNGNLVYSIYRYFSGTMHEEYNPLIYNTIRFADTETWAPYSSPPNPYMEYVHASIGPPGWR